MNQKHAASKKPRHGRPSRLAKRRAQILVFGIAIVALAGIGTTAYAYFTSHASGSGAATTGTAGPTPDHLTISPTSGTVVAGQPVTYTVTAFDTFGGPSNVSSSANLTISGGTCTHNTCASTSVGSQTVTATYLTRTAQATQTVTRAATSTTVNSSSPGTSVVGQQVIYSATVSVTAPGSGTTTGNVEFLDGGSAISACGGASGSALSGTTAACAVTYTGVGSHTITAKYLGDANFSASPTSSSISQTVSQAATTSAVVSTTGSPSVVGQSVTYTATVSINAPGAGTPTGKIEFLDAGTAVSTCGGASGNALSGTSASCAVTYTGVGSHTITVKYLGDANFSASPTSSSITQTVNKAATTATVLSGTNPSVVGQSVTYTATLSVTAPGSGTPTGKIEFLDAGTAISTCGGASGNALSGTSASCAVTYTGVGSHTITAAYLGDANFSASPTSSSITQTVNKAATTATVLSGTNPSVVGQSVTYTATVSVTAPGAGTPTGKIEFLDAGTAISTCGGASGNALSGTSATCAVAYPGVGSHTVTAAYLGDANFSASPTSSSITQTVNQAATTTAVVSGTNPSAISQAVTYTATVSVASPGSGTPTGSVEFLDGATPIATCGGTSGNALSGTSATCQVTYSAAGTHTITAKYLGDANFASSAASSPLTQTVNTFGAASQLVFTQQPDGSTGTSTSFPIQPKVTVEDALGNVVTSPAMTVTLSTGSGSNGSLTGCTSGVTTSGGVATFAGCKWSQTGNGDTIKATSGALTATSDPFNITFSASKTVFSTSPNGGANGVAWTTQPVVTVEDTFGNVVTAASTSMTLTVSSGNGTVSCTPTTVTANYGVATFAGCNIVGTAGTFRVATNSSLSDGSSSSFSITAGAATQVQFTTNPSSPVGSGSTFNSQPKVTVEDSGGNTVTSPAVAVTLAITSGTGTLSCSVDPVTTINGVASFTGCKITSGSNQTFTLTASAPGLTSDTVNVHVT